MSKGVRYNSGRQRYLGPLLETEFPIALDPVQYTGAIVYANDGNIYYSNGVDWVVPVDRVTIARPIALTPTTPTEQAQLRLSAFYSSIDLVQTGVYFEVSLSESFTTPLFSRTISGDGISMYQMLYPEDGIEPGTVFYWRGRYISGAEQSAFSVPIQQTFPDLIAQPVQITPAGSIQGAVTISDYESPFGLIFVQSEIEFYDATGVTLLETVTDTVFGRNQFTIPNTLTEGTTYTWRARRGGKIGLSGATQFSPWTGKRAVVNGARSIVLTYDTALMSALTIGVPLAGTVNCTINWGDGLSDTYTTAGVKTHTYAGGTTGTVTVTISGTLTTWGGQSGITAAQQQALTRVESIGFQLGLTSISRAFQNTSVNLVYISPQMPPDITDMSFAFQGSATQADLRTLNVSNITNMQGLFFRSTSVGPQIEGWDVSKVTNVEQMFGDSRFNRPFDGCNWASLTSMFRMFAAVATSSVQNGTSFNQPINNWNVSNVTNMSQMFALVRNENAGSFVNFNQPIGNWDVSNVTNMSYMFGHVGGTSSWQQPYTRPFNQPLNTWNVSNVTNMEGMFGTNVLPTNSSFPQTNSFNQSLTNWNVTKVTNMARMFATCVNFAGDISTWSCAACTSMFQMFAMGFRTSGPNPILQSGSSVWQTPEVTTCASMFRNNASFNRNIFLWKLPKCTDISNMCFNDQFGAGATPVFQSGTDVWETPLVTNASIMFGNNTAFNGALGLWDVSSITNMSGMFYDTRSFNQPIGGWDTSNVTNMSGMFENALVFNQPIGTWNTGNVTNMSFMFCSNASNIVMLFNQNIGAWDVSKVTNMSFMFGKRVITGAATSNFNNGGSSDINNWDTSSVTTMASMFGRADATNNFISLFNQPIGNWDVSKVTDMTNMFGMRNSTDPTNVSSFNQDISTWELNPDINLGGFMVGPGTSTYRAFSPTNYSLLLAGWANYISTINGPYTKTTAFTGIKYTNTTIFPGERFDDGEAGRTFLTTARGVVVSDADDPDGDGVYTFNSGTGIYTNTNSWYFVKTSGSWKLFDNNDTIKATGTGDVAAPWLATAWDGDLEFADVLNNGLGWTITDGGLL
jgi:surface protein